MPRSGERQFSGCGLKRQRLGAALGVAAWLNTRYPRLESAIKTKCGHGPTVQPRLCRTRTTKSPDVDRRSGGRYLQHIYFCRHYRSSGVPSPRDTAAM
jgi:hypothetical protein